MPRSTFDHTVTDAHVEALRRAGFVVEDRGQRLIVSLNRPISLVEVQQVIDAAGLRGWAQRGEGCVVVEVRE